MATTVYIDTNGDGVTTQAPLSAGQATQVGGTQGPNATHNSTGAAGEFIGANFNYINITAPASLDTKRGVDANGELSTLPQIVQIVQQRATTVVVNQSGADVYMIVEGPHGWGKTTNDLLNMIKYTDSETGGTTARVVDSVNLSTTTLTITDALALA
jgi:hypothetical protein